MCSDIYTIDFKSSLIENYEETGRCVVGGSGWYSRYDLVNWSMEGGV